MMDKIDNQDNSDINNKLYDQKGSEIIYHISKADVLNFIQNKTRFNLTFDQIEQIINEIKTDMSPESVIYKALIRHVH